MLGNSCSKTVKPSQSIHQPNIMDTIEKFLTVEIIIIVLCLTTNVVIILAIYRSPMIYDVSYQFIYLLAFSDIGIGLCTIPLDIIISVLRVDMSFHMCMFTESLTFVFTNVSTLLLLCGTIERFLAIRWPYVYLKHVDVRNVRYAGLACFILGFVFAMGPTVPHWYHGSEHHEADERKEEEEEHYEAMLNGTCFYLGVIDNNFVFAFQFGLLYILPAFAMCVVFSYLSFIVRKHQKRDTDIQTRFGIAKIKNQQNKLLVFVIIVLTFSAVRVPLLVISLLTVFRQDLICSWFQDCHAPDWYYLGVIIFHFQSVLNAFVFTVNDKIRRRVVALIFKRGKEYNSQKSHVTMTTAQSSKQIIENDKKIKNTSGNSPLHPKRDVAACINSSPPIQKISTIFKRGTIECIKEQSNSLPEYNTDHNDKTMKNITGNSSPSHEKDAVAIINSSSTSPESEYFVRAENTAISRSCSVHQSKSERNLQKKSLSHENP